jgi:hypothetical protein
MDLLSILMIILNIVQIIVLVLGSIAIYKCSKKLISKTKDRMQGLLKKGSNVKDGAKDYSAGIDKIKTNSDSGKNNPLASMTNSLSGMKNTDNPLLNLDNTKQSKTI